MSQTLLNPWPASDMLLPGTCDSHCHVIGPAARFPLQSSAMPAPPAAATDHPKEALFALHARLGIARSVIVQSARHGLDNAAVEDAIAAGGGRYLGIAIVRTDVDDAELARLAGRGFRGVRFNFMRHLGAAEPIEAVMALAPRLGRHGLHLQVHFESDLIHGLAPHLAQSPVPVVIDHMGRVDAGRGPDHADFVALRRLLADPRFLVKVSGVDRIDRTPPYADGVALARLLVDSFPDRCLWGTDWPHVNHHHQPDDDQLAALTTAIAPDRDLRERLLVRNAEKFYRFDPLPSLPSPPRNP